MSQPSHQAGSAHPQIRSERLEAIQAVLKVFLKHLDPASRCIGVVAPDGSFIGLDMKAIALGSGLCQRRCERAIATLKRLGLIEVYPPRRHNFESACVKYSKARAVRAVTPSFLEYLLQIGFFKQAGCQGTLTSAINKDME